MGYLGIVGFCLRISLVMFIFFWKNRVFGKGSGIFGRV